MALLNALGQNAVDVPTPDTPGAGTARRYRLFIDETLGLPGIPTVKDNTGVITRFGGAVAAATLPSALTLGDAGAIGVGTSFARADHSHPATALSDGTHGARSGGTLHAIASGAANGFMSAADFTKLGGVAASAAAVGSATPSTSTLGNAGAVGVSALAARQDHAHPVTALDDGTHGSRSGGTLHAAASGGANGFMSSSDFTKLAGISSGAAALSAVTPATQTLGDAGTVGVGTTAARSDHVHPLTALADGTHGSRAGGTLHANASGAAAGFMTASDFTKLGTVATNAAALSAVTPATQTLGDAGTVGVGTTAARSDHVHPLTALTDGTHGARAGGTLHANASTSVAGFMSAAQFNKVGAEVNVVTDLLADPTGNVDATALINAWITGLATTGVLYNPPSSRIRIDGPVNVSKDIRFKGGERRTSIYSAGTAGNDMFNVTADGVLFEGLRFSAGAAGVDNAALRTGGYAVNFTGSSDSSGVRNCDCLFQWSAFQSSGSLHFFEDLNIREYGNNAINGACILINGSGDRYIRRITTDNGSNPTGFAGVRVTQCASLVISDCNIIHATTCLALEPGNGLTVPSVEAVNCFFDTSVYGMRINPTGTGVVYRSKFTNCWFGTHTTAGAEMVGSQWDGLTFDNCDFYGSPIGINTPSGGGRWTVTGGSRFAGASTAAINLTGSATHFPKIIGCDIGAQSAFGVNAVGIAVAAGTYKGLQIQNNSVIAGATGNTTPLTLGAVTLNVAAEAGSYRIEDNAGINPRGTNVAPAVPATNVAATNNTGFNVLVFIIGGTLTTPFITINGVASGQTVVPTSAQAYALGPGSTIALTFSAAPTWKWLAQ